MQRFGHLSSINLFVFLVFIVLITLSPSIHFMPFIEFNDCHRLIQLFLLGGLLVNSAFSQPSKTISLLSNKVWQIATASLLALAVTSAYFAEMPRYAVIEITIFIGLCYLSILISDLFIQNKKVFIDYLTYILWASILLYMLSFYVGYATAMLSKKQLIWPLPLNGFSSVRFFQQYQLAALGLICLPLLNAELKNKTRIYLYLALTFWWVLLFYAASRGALLAWLFAMLTTALIYRKQAWPFLRIQFISAINGLATYLLLFKAIPFWLAETTTSKVTAANEAASAAIVTSSFFRGTMSDRLDLWKGAYEMIKDFPLLGVGPMNYPFHISFGTYPHNSVLLIASEWGLPATIIILATAFYVSYRWVKKFNPTWLKTAAVFDQHLVIILFFSIIANSAYSLVSGVIVMPISQVLFFTIIGLLAGQYTINKQQTYQNTLKPPQYLRPIFAIVILVAMGWSVLPELKRGIMHHDRPMGRYDREFALSSGTINPRIWMQQRPSKQTQTKKE